MKSVGNLVSKSLPTSSVTHMITVRVMMFSATQQYFSYIVVVSFIGGTLQTLVVIGTDCTGIVVNPTTISSQP